MGHLVIIKPFLPIILIFLAMLLVLRLLKAKKRPKRDEQLGGCTTLSRFKGTTAVSWGYDLGQDDYTQAAFTDSWEKELGQHVENHSVFTDRAFQ